MRPLNYYQTSAALPDFTKAQSPAKDFGTTLGWCENKLLWIEYPDDLTFDLGTPVGHLPGFCFSFGCRVSGGLNLDQTGWSGWRLLDRLV